MKQLATNTRFLACVLFLSLLYMGSCTKTELKTNTTNDVNIVGYLDKHLDSFSLFRQILDRTRTADFLNAYGAYTCFAVTNGGVKTWLTSIGAPSVEAADVNTLKDMVRFHLIEDTLATSLFTDGKMPKPTMFGQYLIAGVSQKEGISSYLINRQGTVLQSNLRVGNGLIHVIDHVLVPAKLSLAAQLAADPKYSIFLEAVKATGYYGLLDSVNTKDTNARWITLIAESNSALADSGINSFAQLKSKYSKNGNPLLPSDTLNLYVQYHIVPGLKFLGDLILSPTQETKAPQEVVSTKLINQEVYLNDDDFNGVHEAGIQLPRATSDLQATNGVLHNAKSHFSVKFRKPEAVYWDVSDFDEIRKLPAYYRKADYAAPTNGWYKASDADRPLKDIDWQFLANGPRLEYIYSTTGTITNYACNNDINKMGLGIGNRPGWIDYRSPVVIKGRYKVWVCYRYQRQSTNTTMSLNVLVNGIVMQRPFAFTDARPSGSDGELEAINYKRYTENTSGNFVGRCVGVVDIATTGRQTVRLQVTAGSNSTCNLDMIHFIPVDQNQILPRFKPDGSKLYQ